MGELMPQVNPKINRKRLSSATPVAEVASSVTTKIKSPQALRHRLNRLLWTREQKGSTEPETFEKVLGLLEKNLTIAIQEVIEQPVCFRANASFERGAASVDFSIERAGQCIASATSIWAEIIRIPTDSRACGRPANQMYKVGFQDCIRIGGANEYPSAGRKKPPPRNERS